MAAPKSKKRPRRYRAGVVRRQTRFDEMMENVIAGGTRRCESCHLPRPSQRLCDGAICDACRDLLKRVAAGEASRARREARASGVHEPVPVGSIIYTDASFKNGMSGLAMVGALGEHYRPINAESSTQAEVLALGWAMSAARARGLRDVTFRTDCQAAASVHGGTGRQHGWKVEWVPRFQNADADRLAGLARKAQVESDWAIAASGGDS